MSITNFSWILCFLDILDISLRKKKNTPEAIYILVRRKRDWHRELITALYSTEFAYAE